MRAGAGVVEQRHCAGARLAACWLEDRTVGGHGSPDHGGDGSGGREGRHGPRKSQNKLKAAAAGSSAAPGTLVGSCAICHSQSPRGVNAARLRQPAMNCVDDSSDGEPPPGAWADDAEEITSDGEQPVAAWAWQPAAGGEAAVVLRQLNGQLPPSGQLQQQGSLEACQPRGARAFSRAAPARAPPRGSRAAATFRRPMKTAAAAEADRAATERVAADEAQLEAVPGQEQQSTAPAAGMLEPGSRPAPAPIPPPRPPVAAASFLNRRVLPPSQGRVQELQQQLQRSTPVTAAAAAAAAAAVAAGGESGPVSVQAVQQAHWEATNPAAAAGSSTWAALDSRPSASHQAAGTLAPGMAAGAAPAATFHRTAEGLNVVHLNRQQQRGVDAHAGGRGGAKAKADSVNSGWGNNFVRIDLKVRGSGVCSQGIGQGRGCEGLCTQRTCSSCQRQESGCRHAPSKDSVLPSLLG